MRAASSGMVSPARQAAYKILLAVEKGHAHSDDLLRGRAVSALTAADRNLATTLVLGVLRWQIRLDYQTKTLLKRPNAKLDAEVRIALRLGAFQLLHLDRVPAHAAIDESVELAKQAGHRFAAGMVNAVLRKIAAAQMQFADGTVEELALATAHPAWMVERWARFYGLEAAQVLCRHGQTQPTLTLRLTDAEAEQELAASGVVLGPGELLTAARTVVSGDATLLRERSARLQDEGSQLVAEIASAAMPEDQGPKRILDACAAPGGKTLIVAERHVAARLVACEVNPERCKRLRERLTDYTQRIECRLADATSLTEEGMFDLVLADVPCSGTGTLGRNPEIRHRLLAEDLPRQAERQRGLLKAALRTVKAGGCVVYSTCSLEPEENEQVVEAVLGEERAARRIAVEPVLDGMRASGVLTASGAERLRGCVTQEGALRLLPGVAGTDGFFVAMLEKR